MYSTQAKNVYSFVSPAAKGDCCGSEPRALHEGEIKSILLFFSLSCIAVLSPPLLLEFQLRHMCSPLLEQRMCLMETVDGSVSPG